MKTKQKKTYDAPQLTVVAFRTERGYAISSATLDTDQHLFEFNSSNPNVTQYNEDDSWASYTWNN